MQFLNSIFFYINHYFIYFIALLIILFVIWQIKRGIKDNLFLQKNDWFIILDWKFWAWKTRFMVNLQKDWSNFINISNFYSWYTHIRFNSLDDLINLLLDIQKLSEYQNYDENEVKHIYSWEWNEVLNKKLENIKELKKYKNIPKDWYYTKFLWTCDEFQNLFFSRSALSNFSWGNKILLKLLHQVRHMNSLFIFATQNADELDIKFRRLSTFYVNTWSNLWDWFFGYNIYFFENNLNWRKINEEEMKKINKAPIFKLNKYKLNNIIFKINRKLLDWKRKYNWVKKLYKINYRFDELDFHSKYNCDPDNSIYKPWYLFEYLDKFYKEEKRKKSFDKLNIYL